jgi:hypothetical protein
MKKIRRKSKKERTAEEQRKYDVKKAENDVSTLAAQCPVYLV